MWGAGLEAGQSLDAQGTQLFRFGRSGNKIQISDTIMILIMSRSVECLL